MQFVIPSCRESFLENQKNCGQAAMTEISKKSGFVFGLIEVYVYLKCNGELVSASKNQFIQDRESSPG
jgi:hypothetical protein